MKPIRTSLGRCVISLTILFTLLTSAYGLDCTVSGQQSLGGEYCIVMPPAGVPWNGRLVIWAHGFQDAGTPVGIPLDQLCFDGTCTPDLMTAMGFAFATNSYRRTGLAVVEGAEDILDLVDLFTAYSVNTYNRPPDQVYLVGASEGGLISTLLAEEYPYDFDAGLALCGPIGDFPYQINYLGDARVTFEYFFPNRVPGYGIFNGDHTTILSANWSTYFAGQVKPLLIANTSKFQQWVKVAGLPVDSADATNTMLASASVVLRYAVINLQDSIAQLGGLPFENRWKWYSGSSNDFWLNWRVKRFRADPTAVDEMKVNYNTSGRLDVPLITMHTTKDPLVPYFHEALYNLKALASGSLLGDHVNIPIARYGHCSFTAEEALAGFALMLLYNNDLQVLSGVGSIFEGSQLQSFEAIAQQQGIPYQIDGLRLEAIFNTPTP